MKNMDDEYLLVIAKNMESAAAYFGYELGWSFVTHQSVEVVNLPIAEINEIFEAQADAEFREKATELLRIIKGKPETSRETIREINGLICNMSSTTAQEGAKA